MNKFSIMSVNKFFYINFFIIINTCNNIAYSQSKPAILNAQGETGLTSYITLPFTNQITAPSSSASPFLAPGNLFWQNGTYFTNLVNLANAKAFAAAALAKGLVPESGSQNWVWGFEVSQPANLFPNEPAYVSQYRGTCCSTGEFQAWVQWVKARPNLPIMAADGGSMGTDFRSWGSSWGHISPLMPLQSADCPPDMSSCTYGDWYAYRWGQTAELTGTPAIGLSDFSDSQPYAYSTQEGFNPEIIAGFEAAYHISVPPGTTSQQSLWINQNAISAWNDYLATGYAKFFGALANRLATATKLPSLVSDQCAYWPSLRRFFGIDPRIIGKYVSSKNYICIWDEQSIQVGRAGEDPVGGIAGYGYAAARDPWTRNGVALESEDTDYWNAIASIFPNLSAVDQNERGLKILKRLWLEASWAHIATETGAVRRALAYVQRDYFDVGTIDPQIQKLIQTIYPTRPFGFGIYYSEPAERAVEQHWWGEPWLSYGGKSGLLALKQGGVPVNYYVSDAALSNISGASAPVAWILADNASAVTPAEMKLLNSSSNNRVFTSVQQALAFSGAPLRFTNGLTGTGFYDQNNRLIITVTNISDNPTQGLIQLQGLNSGTYKMLDLFSNTSSTVTISHGSVSIPITESRWDTMAFALTNK
jgi:hypothetical protein